MRVRFTHGFDLLYSIALIVGSLGVTSAVVSIIGSVLNLFESLFKSLQIEWLWVLLSIALFFAAYVGSIMLLMKTVLPQWLPTFLYVRTSSRTAVTPSEAEKIGFLFDGSLGGVWYPMSHLRKVHPDYRKEMLFRFANKIAAQNGWQRIFEMPENQSKKPDLNQEKSFKETPKFDTRTVQALACARALGFTEIPKDIEVAKQAFRRKMQGIHPDKFAGAKPEVRQNAEEMAKQLNAAFDFLQSYVKAES